MENKSTSNVESRDNSNSQFQNQQNLTSNYFLPKYN